MLKRGNDNVASQQRLWEGREEIKITKSFAGGSFMMRCKEASGACSALKRGLSHGRDS